MQDSIVNDNLKKAGIKKEMEYEYLKKKTDSDQLYDRQLAKKNFYTWILAVLFVAASAIVYILWNRYKLKQRLKEVEMRNKIASDLHDDVGSTLSSIRMYSSLVKNQPNQTPVAAELLEKISNNSKEMIENMGDIVWMIKPGNDDFKNIENKMLNFANELCVPAGINFEFSNDSPSEDLRLPMEQRRDLYLIFKEAVNNAVKYSSCRQIQTIISQNANLLTMTIRDDGTGFDATHSTFGNGLLNMQKRTKAHGGTFQLTSLPNKGTEIIVSLPV
jgi:signal transduction histidine kinase